MDKEKYFKSFINLECLFILFKNHLFLILGFIYLYN